MAQLYRTPFTVVLDEDGADVVYEDKLLWIDKLNAEQDTRKYGLKHGDTDPLAFLTVVTWRALVRVGKTELPFPEFREKCVYVSASEDADDVVDPTPATGPTPSL